MIRGVTHAIVLMQVRDEHDLSPVACWPACGDTPPALLATARDAIRRQQEIVCQRDASTLLTADSGGVLACPVMTGSRMTGVVAMAIGQHGEPERQAALEQLRCGCTWLTMLVRRESESGKHYLATMLEMAAMFLEYYRCTERTPWDGCQHAAAADPGNGTPCQGPRVPVHRTRHAKRSTGP
jgi:hypothetical protein